MAHVLLIGNYRPSLHLARALAREGHEVLCGVDDPNPYLFKSRAVCGSFSHVSLEGEPERALDQIEQYLRVHPEIEVLIPVSDPAAHLFSRCRARFESLVRLALPSPTAFEVCGDKAASFALCDQLAVPLARRIIVSDHEALMAAVAAIGRPCVIKPVDASHYLFGEKAVLLHLGDEAATRLPHWPAEHGTLCVQRFVGGERHEVSFAAHHGQLLGAIDCVVVRTDRSDGTGYTTELVSVRPLPAIAQALEAMLAALNYTGVGNVEFIADKRTGDLTFLELDPRLSSSVRIAEICGLPMSRWMVELAEGAQPAAPSDPWSYPAGRRLVWTKGDLVGLRKAWGRGKLSPVAAVLWFARLARSALRRHHATLDLRDLWPTAWIYLLGPLERRRSPRDTAAAEARLARRPALSPT